MPHLLYVMRHGLAAASANTGKDRDRPLTPEGIRGVEEVGRTLVSQGATLGHIVTSPYLRAHHTAEIMASTFGLAEASIEAIEELEPDASPPLSLLRTLAEREDGALLVGHHPMVIALLRMLVRDVAALPLGLHPGMLVGIERIAPPPLSQRRGIFGVKTILRPPR